MTEKSSTDCTTCTSTNNKKHPVAEIVGSSEVKNRTANRLDIVMGDGDILPSASLVRNLFLNSRHGHEHSVNQPLQATDTYSESVTREMVFHPNQNDILFPISGMSQWPGNEFFLAKIDEFRNQFLSCETRSMQIKIARQVVQDVMHGATSRIETPARFLLRRRDTNEVAGTHFKWSLMDETSVLVRLGRAFRGEIGGKKSIKLKSRIMKKKIKTEQTENKFVNVTQSPVSNISEVVENYDELETTIDEAECDHDPLAHIKALCTVSSNINEEEAESSGDESDHPSQTKRLGSDDTDKVDVHEIPLGMFDDPGDSKHDEVALPKGVTVRPSGKWVRNRFFVCFGNYFFQFLFLFINVIGFV
jgi:hypothetical protein